MRQLFGRGRRHEEEDWREDEGEYGERGMYGSERGYGGERGMFGERDRDRFRGERGRYGGERYGGGRYGGERGREEWDEGRFGMGRHMGMGGRGREGERFRGYDEGERWRGSEEDFGGYGEAERGRYGGSSGYGMGRGRFGEHTGMYGGTYGGYAGAGYGGMRGGGMHLGMREEERRFRGRGPKGYRRSDQRIFEDICDRLTEDPELDATNIEVRVENCQVTLSGMVDDRDDKRRAEQLAEHVSGVADVFNHIRVRREEELGGEQARPGNGGRLEQQKR